MIIVASGVVRRQASEKHNGIQWDRDIMMRNIPSGSIIKSKHEVVS
jgi:hypothetical protein